MMYPRSLSRPSLALAAVAATLLLAAPAPSPAKEQLKLKSSLDRIDDDDASGKLIATLRPGKSKIKIVATRLDAGTSYDVLVGGAVEATATSDDSGKLRIGFRSGGSPDLDFDPNGASIEISDGSSTALGTVFSGAGESSGVKLDERSSLAATGLIPGASGDTRYRTDKGRTKFSVEIEDVPAGPYDLLVGGVLRGTINVGALGEGEIEFDSGDDDGDELLLDFDPRGETIDVTNAEGIVLTGDSVADVPNVNTCEATEVEVPLTSTGVDADASGDARLRTKPDCDVDFEVEIEDVPVGVYDVVIDSIVRGSITVIDDGETIEGEVEFDSDPDDPGELLLDFDPEGATIEIVQGATVFFSSVFDTGNGTTNPGVCSVTEIDLPLVSAGVFGSAKGDVRYRLENDCDDDLRVEIEDVPPGTYRLTTDGIERGTFEVVLVDDEPEGEIEFDNDPDQPGELPLTFDPVGTLVEVRTAEGVVILARQLPGA